LLGSGSNKTVKKIGIAPIPIISKKAIKIREKYNNINK
jgi:hypothetical protein